MGKGGEHGRKKRNVEVDKGKKKGEKEGTGRRWERNMGIRKGKGMN